MIDFNILSQIPKFLKDIEILLGVSIWAHFLQMVQATCAFYFLLKAFLVLKHPA
jgi:hypothetical protein